MATTTTNYGLGKYEGADSADIRTEHNGNADILDSKLKKLDFDTIAELKASTDIEVGDKVKTWGYYTKGDGGGAEYLIVAAATGTDDGGSYHDLVGISGQAELIDHKIKGYINIKWFGAKSDLNQITKIGTDVSPFLEAALDFSDKNLGMSIKIVGNYYLGTAISTTTNINLFGEHRPSKLLITNDNSPNTIELSPSEIYIKPNIIAIQL